MYEVRYYDPQGRVVKEQFVTAAAAAQRWMLLVSAGHKSVKLKTVHMRLKAE